MVVTRRRRNESGTGVFGTTFGFTVFLIFLLLAVQVLFGLYARTTVTAVAADIAQDAAEHGGALDQARRDQLAAEARHRLGRYGEHTTFRIATIDADADGIDDTVAVTVDADLPVLLPLRWSGYSPTTFSRTMRSRLEVFQGGGR